MPIVRQTHQEKYGPPCPVEPQSELLLFYLMHLRACRGEEEPYKEWFARPLTALYYFDRKLIEETEDTNLLVRWVA